MADIPSKEVPFCRAGATIQAVAGAVRGRQHRTVVPASLQYKDDLAAAPGPVNELFKQPAERCLTQSTAVGALS